MERDAKTAYTTGADQINAWFAEVEHGNPPTRFDLCPPFAELDVRPGRLVLLGGAPGSGKTAALLQIAIDLLRLNTSARLLMANVEMAPTALLERIVARLAGVPLTAITDRTLSANQKERLGAVQGALASIAGRLAFLRPPYSLEHVHAARTSFGASVVIVDYIQRFAVGNGRGDQREQLEAAATALRRLCDAEAAVLVASAVARQRDAGGSTYRGLNLASFRGSSELEYGADAAYIFKPGEGGAITLRCEKNRYGRVADIATRFEPATQSFTPAPSGRPASTRGRRGREEERCAA
jgi:replicative DNA helicase